MTDIDEQRRKVEELKRKILEQKKKSESASPSDQSKNIPVVEAKERTAPLQGPVQEIKQQSEVGSPQRKQEVINKAEKNVLQQQEEQKRHTEKEKATEVVQHTVALVSLQAYAQTLKQAWSNGSLSKDEENLLSTLRKSMGISDEEHVSLEQEVRLEIYLQAIVDSWKNGSITPQDLDRLDALRERFNISAEEHMRLEKQVRQEILKQR
jgi:alpha-L-arabinofuranosidase